MKILNVPYDNLTVEEALKAISDLSLHPKKSNVFFLNIDCLCKAHRDQEYSAILNNAELVLPDGVGLKIVSKLFGERMRENCNGTDLSPQIIKQAAARNLRIFFFGGKEGVAPRAAERMRGMVAGINIVGALPGYFKDEEQIIRSINAAEPDILFVALGSPLQEKWISKNRERLKVKICIGVGAFLDYVAGEKPRAPAWMIKINAEWFWRILVEPGRLLKRYTFDFLCLISLVYRRLKAKR